MATRVCITVDTEFSIGGAFADADRTPVGEPLVWCDVGGRSQGLGFLLEQFQRSQIPATFFVEALQQQYFRHDPMGAIARRIHAEGHDVQLHAHPCWSVFRHSDWRERVRQQPRQDDFHGRDEDSSLELIREGLATFGGWDVPAPTVFRSGSLQHDDSMYRALARSGMPYSSSVGVAMFDSGDERYRLYSGMHRRHGVVEFPVLTFEDWRFGVRSHRKVLTISGTSFAETRLLLERAHAAQLPLVVVLTHPFEYVQCRDHGRSPARTHGVNQERLTQLCRYLDGERGHFLPCTLGGAAPVLAAAVDTAAVDADNLLLQGSSWRSLHRMATQVTYDRYGALALQRLERAA
ncbi:hypothetical protein [Rugamonas sp.]|uniref:hypothetical protein n=1 Tax=Rugamonas sp. TaxID=1926287 RepID=UPI0025FE4F37|nr:hypothetical protein [Rugamonas sp.]